MTRHSAHVIIPSMPAPAGPLSPSERLAFCASLAPEVAQVTAAYYDPAAAHPYLRSPNGGGTLQRDEATEDFEKFTQVSVAALPGYFLTEELATRSGLPEGITPDGIIWSLITDRHKYPTRMRGGINLIHWGLPDIVGIIGTGSSGIAAVAHVREVKQPSEQNG